MKIAISSNENTIKSQIDQRFGRCKYFLIIEIENNEIKNVNAIENEGAIQGHGAGIKAAQQIGNLEIKEIITGNLGPNATAVLNQLNIKAYHASGDIEKAIEKFNNNALEEISEIVEAHSGITNTSDNNNENNNNESIVKNEKVFFPLLNDKDMDSEISQHFGHAPFFGSYDLEKKELKIIENDLNHTDPDKSPIDQIQEVVNPTIIFAKGIGGRAIELIAEKGIALKTENFNTVKEVIENWDKLEDQTQNCGQEQQ